MEEHLNKYGRTKNISDVSKRPLVWTKDETKGFKSLKECYKIRPSLLVRTVNNQEGEKKEITPMHYYA